MNRLSLLLLLICTSVLVAAQPPKRKPANGKQTVGNFLDQQWWIGLKGGLNLSQADPQRRFSAFSPTNYDFAELDKQYDDFNATGSQATLEITYYYKGFSFSFQPTYRHSRYTYNNSFNWYNPEQVDERLELTFDQTQRVTYADLPLLVKYDLLHNKIRPYVQVGVFYSILTGADRSINVSGTDYASGGVNSFTNEPLVVGTKELFQSYWGLAGGVGVDYNLGNVRLVLDATYWRGMSNLTRSDSRYANDQLAGIGDVPDDLRLHNIIISAGVLFPTRFLSSSFKSLDR